MNQDRWNDSRSAAAEGESFVAAITRRIGDTLKLQPDGSWPATRHRLDKRSAHALIAAVAAGRPLLVRGEPGVGKSQLARAAAHLLGRRFLCAVVQPQTEYQELLWLFDHTSRLADAQLAGATGNSNHLKDPKRYIAPGPLWYALNWHDAAKQENQNNFRPPANLAPSPEIGVSGAQPPTEVEAGDGVVLLIDEIDKADISVANGLLEVLGNGQFDVPASGETVRASGCPPLVVLTSNDTRELPAAVVRRCVVLDLALPEDSVALRMHLVAVGHSHFDQFPDDLLKRVADQIADDRERCHDLPRTGQAEFLDLLRALDDLQDRGETDLADWVDHLGEFFQKSHVNRV